MHAKILAVGLAVPMTMGAMTPSYASVDDADPSVTDPTPVVTVETPATDPAPSADVSDTSAPAPTVAPTEVPVVTPAAPAKPAAARSAKKAKRSARPSRRTRAAGVVAMRSKGTVYSPVKAANRLERWASRGVSGYHNQCLRLADNAYQPKGGRTGTALQQWYRAKRHGYGHPRDRKPRIGAQMFWRTSNPAGHIATYVGNGKAVTNMPGGRVKKINWRTMNNWGPYLGWAEPYYG